MITGAELLKADCASANTTLRQKHADDTDSTRVTGHRPPRPEA